MEIGTRFIEFQARPESAERCVRCGRLLENGEQVVIVPNPSSAQDPGWIEHRVCPEEDS